MVTLGGGGDRGVLFQVSLDQRAEGAAPLKYPRLPHLLDHNSMPIGLQNGGIGRKKGFCPPKIQYIIVISFQSRTVLHIRPLLLATSRWKIDDPPPLR